MTVGTTSPAIAVNSLRKSYGDTVAVDNVSFEVQIGEIFCIVGPNGAGKTTTIECLEGHRRPESGTVRVLGLDPGLENNGLRRRVGVQLQEANLPDRLRVWEALDLFASFYQHPVDWEKLLYSLDLQDKRKTYFTRLSGGQKQRLFVALALINDPEIVYLDELTTGLDPHARRSIWKLIEEIRDRGRTVVLTTHFMDEAEQLADRVAVMHRGKIVALDKPSHLVADAQARNLEEVFLTKTQSE
jgi:ABC-2 type transport system ATP-binding protein